MNREKFKVLCVEDEAAVRKLLGRSFEKFGFSVETVESAEKALEILSNEHFDAAVVDMVLPGMNGVELCLAIRSFDSSIFLTAITGFATKFEFSECKKAGFDAYFTKPLSMEQLCDTVGDGCLKREKKSD
jgi:CheY-like chemotaxis protein